MFNIQKAIILGAGILVGGFFQSASADFSINNGGIAVSDDQDIVISLKSNPMANLEQACLAVTFARMLSNPSLNNNVTLFVTLDGVSLADMGNRAHQLVCTVPGPMDTDGTVDGEMLLEDNLLAFLGTPKKSDNMVVCPICWKERYDGTKPNYGVLPGDNAPGNAIAMMIGNADKILDF